jgi:hypothetical protein
VWWWEEREEGWVFGDGGIWERYDGVEIFDRAVVGMEEERWR